MKAVLERWQLRQLQSLSLRSKEARSERKIKDYYNAKEGQVYVSYSGGLDSEVLLDLVWRLYPHVPAVFVDTGLEYPENREQVKTHGDRVTWLKPKMPFPQVIEHYGFPVVSKRIAQYVSEVQNSRGETATKRLRLTGIKGNGTVSKMGMISKKWQFLCTAPFKVSHKCCHVMKHQPLDNYAKTTGRAGMNGMRAEEGGRREQEYLEHGCNALTMGVNGRSTPVAFWLDQDIRNYLNVHSVRYSKLYDPPFSARRSGCMFCGFGADQEPEPNRFQRMYYTHPAQWRYCIYKLGMKEVLEYIGVPYKPSFRPEQMELCLA